MRKAQNSMVSYFGGLSQELASASEICRELGVPYYTFGRMILRGEFPQPDFMNRSIRAWHRSTLERHDAALAIRIFAAR